MDRSELPSTSGSTPDPSSVDQDWADTTYDPADDPAEDVAGREPDYPAYDDGSPNDKDDHPAMAERSAPTRRHNAWALLGITAAGVVLALLVGWFGGLLVGKAFGPDPEPTATGEQGVPAQPTEEPPAAPGEPQPLTIAEATLFDPPPGDGAENADRIDLSYDGQDGTTWPTLQYRGSASFGNIKPGVGIIYDLGADHAVSQVTIQTSQPGATVEIRTGTGTDGVIEDFPVVGGPVELAASTDIPVAAGTTTRYILVWITELVQQQGYFQTSLSEVRILGT